LDRHEKDIQQALASPIVTDPGGIQVSSCVDNKSARIDATISEMELKEAQLEAPSPRRMPRKSKRTQTKEDVRVIAVLKF